MSATRVVNLRHEPYDIYIGRPSPYGNPYSWQSNTLAKYNVGSREESIQKYRYDLMNLSRDELIEFLSPLVGKRLGCFCKPLHCHGDVLIELIKDMFGEKDNPRTS